jgi:pimeloyl-ACP methyl ester carboxylesterase
MIKKLNKKYNISYNISSNQSETAIFFIHGLGDSITSFDKQITYFENNFKCIYFDLPGSGENNQIYLDFTNTLDLIEDIFKKESCKSNIILGHSMGGLLGLLLTVNKRISVDLFFAVEASISFADKNFFTHIQEKPIGIGFDEFLASLEGSNGYLQIYFDNVKKTNQLSFKQFSKIIYDNFDNFSSKILSSNLTINYIIGEKSLGFEEREKLLMYPNIQITKYENSEHWVHIDNFLELNNLIDRKIKELNITK